MGRRGRRQVLQLDDSSSHQSRRYGYQGQHNEEKSLPASNPLLDLVGQYNSDDDENSDEEGQEESKQEEVTYQAHEPQPLHVGMGHKQPDHVVKTEGSNIDLEVASFLAEIESISADSQQPVSSKEEMWSAQGDPSEERAPDYGYVLKSDANVDKEGDQEKKARQSSSTAYKAMFVKGESEFLKHEDKPTQKDGKADDGEELPEEPVSKWQMVQDETTQYYYYWNTETNEVTWEIPPDYTQYLLLYKEYEEKLAAIPDSRLQVLVERREKKRLEKESKHQSTEAAAANGHPVLERPPAPVDESHSQKTSKHKKHLHHYKDQNDDTESAPRLPVALSNAEGNDHEGKHSVEKHSAVHPLPTEGADHNTTGSLTAFCQEPSLPFSFESIKLLSSYAEDVGKVKSEEMTSFETAGSVAVSEEVEDISVSVAMEANKIELHEKPLTTSEPPVQPDLVSVPDDEVLGEQVSGSKTAQSDPGSEGEKALASKSPNAIVEDDDDFDMDFDDIDDLDRALEKALEKKLEKKKAELQKLELEQLTDPTQTETCPSPLSPLAIENPDSRDLPEESQTVAAESEAEVVAAADVPAEPAAAAGSPAEVVLENSEVAQVTSKRKAEDGQSEEAGENTKPAEKKARLVAYDAYESDEEDEEDRDEQVAEVNESQAVSIFSKEEAEGGAISALPSPPPETSDNLAEIQEKADTALAKLAFLGVMETELSRLQVIAVQLQTRLKDWQEGGLNGEYFFQRVSEVNATLQQYENNAVPPGWACHWDRNFRRYFYTNSTTGESQWDYPEQAGGSDSSTKQAALTESDLAKGENDGSENDVVAKPKDLDGARAPTSGDAGRVEEDLDGAAMSDGDSVTEEGDTSTIKTSQGSESTDLGSKALSLLPSFFPGEPLPPGTELLFGLPPPPPPPLPSDGFGAVEDNYVCHDDSSSDSSICQDCTGDGTGVLNGSEVRSEESTRDEASAGVEDAAEVKEDQSVISKPPQLRFHGTASAYASSFGAVMGSGSSTSLPSDSEVVNVSSSLPQSYSEPRDNSVELSESANPVKSWIGPECPSSPSMEEGPRAAESPGPVAGEGVGQEKHKKRKKEKSQLGSSGLSLKKKGVSSLVQKWQKVKREVEQEERANERRQMAIRQQLDEWKKDNS